MEVIDKWERIHPQLDDGSVLGDLKSHCTNWQPYMADTICTSTHEISHSISAEIRNKAGGRVNSFYLGKNKSATLQEPNFRKRDVAEYVPFRLRESRFNTYVVGQNDWDDTPLYIMDESNAYLAGMECAVYLKEQNHRETESWQDHALGPLEFFVYTAALLITASKRDSGWFDREPKSKDFFRYQFVRFLTNYEKCAKMFPFDRQDKIWDGLKTGEDGKNIREFLKKELALDILNLDVSELSKELFRII